MKEEVTPKINITQRALDQIKLVLENDYTLNENTLRLTIDGKGCNGFDYAIGFDKKTEEDFIIEFNGFDLAIDKFCSYYCQDGEIDYLLDIKNDVEGFLFSNLAEKKYRGKFFKDESKTPTFG
jgi:iron-sulfur cluster assembly accessory protein